MRMPWKKQKVDWVSEATRIRDGKLVSAVRDDQESAVLTLDHFIKDSAKMSDENRLACYERLIVELYESRKLVFRGRTIQGVEEFGIKPVWTGSVNDKNVISSDGFDIFAMVRSLFPSNFAQVCAAVVGLILLEKDQGDGAEFWNEDEGIVIP